MSFDIRWNISSAYTVDQYKMLPCKVNRIYKCLCVLLIRLTVWKSFLLWFNLLSLHILTEIQLPRHKHY